MWRIWKIVVMVLWAFAINAQTGPGGVGSSTDNKLWLKADAITGVSDGGAITTWADTSGNNSDAVQNTAANKPIWDQSNSTFNNKASIHFDGSNDYFDLASLTHAASNYSIWFVYITTNSSGQYLFNTQTGKLVIPHNGAGVDKAYNDGTAQGSNVTGNTVRIAHWELNSAGSKIYLGGTLDQSGLAYTQRAIGVSTKLGVKETGSGKELDGDMAEGIIYNTVLNTAQRIIVENYLGAKYGISIANDKFSYESVHEDDVAGIGREDASNQNTAAESAKIFKVSNASAMGNGDYLLFGHDAGSISSYATTESPNTEIKRIAREWRLDQTGYVGTITITMDTATLPAHASGYSGYVVMIDADGDFSSGSKIYVLSGAGGSTYSASGIGFNDGDYVTFGCARNVYKNTTGNFNVAGNWADGSVPVSGELAIITNNATVTLSANATIGELSIMNTGSLDLSAYTLSIDNNSITNSGTLTMSTGTINYAKAGVQNVNAFTFYSLAVSGSGTKTLTANTTVNGNLTISAGTLDVDNTNNYSLTVKGNWVNSGTFTARNGTVTLSGSSNQSATSNNSSFYNLTVANTATEVSLNDNLTVSNTLTLTDGVITTGSYRIIVSSSAASALAGYSSASFVNGNLRRNIASNTSTYGFPVGNGTGTSNYYLAEIVNGSLTGITYIDSKFKPLTGHSDSEINMWDAWTHGYLRYSTINTAGVWELEPNASPSGGTYSVRLYTANMSGLTDNDFGPLKRPVGSTSGADWTTGGGYLNNSDWPGRTVASGYMQRSGLIGFSEFGGGGGTQGGAGLPIELLSFAVVEDEGMVDLTWTTATENNNSYFTVERSANGLDFEELLIHSGAGNSTTIQTYSSVDRNPYSGTSYYRLKQTDFEGASTESQIVSVFIGKEQYPITISPNPVTDHLIYITDEAQEQQEVAGLVYITDINGHMVYSQKFKLSGSEPLPVNLPHELSQGFYFVNIENSGSVWRQKLLFN